jgi:predicted transport protein
VQQSDLEMDDIVEEIKRYSGYWVKLAVPRNEDNEDIREALLDIQTLRVEVAYPFLIEMYDAYSHQQLSRADFLKILRNVEAYVFRRAICGVPSNSLGKTFANLSGDLDKSDYSESLAATFLLFEGYRRLPDDKEFKQQLLVKDIYNFRNRSFLLKKLENYGSKESANIDDYTIEHIMPQNPNLSEEWQEALGASWSEVWSKYLHTLGNLTLTGYNSELSDSPFQTKRDMEGGFKDSPLRLNQSLSRLEHWNEETIQQRADQLFDRAANAWPMPSLPHDVLERYRNPKGLAVEKEYSFDDISADIDGDNAALLNNFRKRVLNLDSSVKEYCSERYIEYKTVTNFVDVVPESNILKIYLNLPFDAVDDPDGFCKDVTLINHLGQGDVEVNLSVDKNIDDVLYLVLQAFDYQEEEVNV